MNLFHDSDKSRHHKIFLLALAGLLILRIPFLGFLDLVPVRWEQRWDWVESIYQIGTYLLTTFLIWWELDHLTDYHIDTVAVIIIIFFQPMQTLILRYWRFDHNPLAFPSVSSLIIWSIAIVFLIAMWMYRARLPKIQAASFAWFGIGILAGLGFVIIMGYPGSFLYPAGQYFMGPRTLFSMSTLKDIGVKFIYHLGYAAVLEEPLFRGFLWGCLLKLGWQDRKIWIFQAVLFMFAHIASFRWFFLPFLAMAPITSFGFGYLVWRSRRLTSSLAAHGMVNATHDLISGLIAQYLR